ncbi:MAG: hypothetical protein RLY14_1942 [Planctomycetota bacterium]
MREMVGKCLRTLLVLLILGFLFIVNAIRDTRPKSFEVNRIAMNEGWEGTLGTSLFAVLNAAGFVELVEFHDYAFVTYAKVKVGDKTFEMVGMPITGKFYRIDSKPEK